MTPQTLDVLAGWVGFVLTLLIFSYLLADNFLYRLTVYIFVGVAAAYTAVVAVEGVLLPWLRGTLFAPAPQVGHIVLGLIPLLVGLLLLLKAVPALAPVGNLGLAFLIGIGTAVALVGTVSGTLIPQVYAAGAEVGGNLINGLIVILGTITTLLYFQYLSIKRPDGEVARPLYLRVAGAIGQVFLIVTFASLYAGAILSSLSIVSERIAFLLAQIG
ncbi:MAG: hypothetical protein JXN59_19315 [Anaerolineae bacterium]|nr:hypothetical protein [Anaerolineae bacterium]